VAHCVDFFLTFCCFFLDFSGTPKSPFGSQKDYIDALVAHHVLIQAAMKTKQSVDVALAAALEHAVDDFSKMYLPVEGKQ
tara:strand:+ start:709 stop:948 length:240 start_codon:yes stop_codon:yes gene_type:complete